MAGFSGDWESFRTLYFQFHRITCAKYLLFPVEEKVQIANSQQMNNAWTMKTESYSGIPFECR